MNQKLFITFSIMLLTAVTARAQVMPSMPGDPSVMAAPEKRAGVIRIGVVSPETEMGKDFSYSDTPMAVRNTLQVALTEENVEVVFLESALPEKEAKLKKCDYVFISKVTRKKGGGGFGKMAGLGMLAGAAGMIPGAGIAGAIAGAAASTAISTASMSGGFKSKDDVSFEYRLLAADGTTVIPATTTRQKAKKDGEDVLTPQISAATKLVLEKLAAAKPAA